MLEDERGKYLCPDMDFFELMNDPDFFKNGKDLNLVVNFCNNTGVLGFDTSNCETDQEKMFSYLENVNILTKFVTTTFQESDIEDSMKSKNNNHIISQHHRNTISPNNTHTLIYSASKVTSKCFFRTLIDFFATFARDRLTKSITFYEIVLQEESIQYKK
jgi:hypothetical protein